MSLAHYLTPEQVAERLGVSYWTVLRLIDSGKLAAGRVGRLYLVEPAALQRMIEVGKRKPAEAKSRKARTTEVVEFF